MTLDPTPKTLVREAVTPGSSLALSEVGCSAHHGAPCRANTCYTCGAPADPVAGVYLERLYPGRTTCRPCGRLQVHCSCRPPETVRRRQTAPAHAIPVVRTPVLRAVAPASESELAAAWGDR